MANALALSVKAEIGYVVKIKNRQAVNMLLKDLDLGEAAVSVASIELKADIVVQL